MYDWMKMIELYERILPGLKEGDLFNEGRESLDSIRKTLSKEMRERLEILEECCDDVTEPPWCGFSDEGKMLAIMAAGREGDVFTFDEPPKEADAHYILLIQPHVTKALIDRVRTLEHLAGIEEDLRWTKDLVDEKVEDGNDD